MGNLMRFGDKMCKTYLEEFKQEMGPAKEIYAAEIEKFAKKFEFLGELTIHEEPDIDTVDYIYSFENLNGTSEEVLDQTMVELYNHMTIFSKANGISEFSKNTTILYDW